MSSASSASLRRLLAVGLSGVALIACAEAGGEVRGGDLTEAGAAAATPPAGVVASDSEPLFYPDGTGVGSKWSDLYRDYFGPTGQPGSCSLEASCHGEGGAGAKSGGGIECFTVKGCRQSLIDKGVLSLEKDPADPDKSGLFVGLLRLRGPDGNPRGFMPKRPDGLFSDLAVERMKTWVRDGAKDD